MTEEHINLDHIATLARVHLEEDERNELSKSLEAILEHINKMSQINIDGVEPSAHAFPLYNVLRNDETGTTFAPKTVLMNAPKQRDNLIIVPKVVE